MGARSWEQGAAGRDPKQTPNAEPAYAEGFGVASAHLSRRRSPSRPKEEHPTPKAFASRRPASNEKGENKLHRPRCSSFTF